MGPIETMVPWLPGQKLNGNSAPAVGHGSGLPGQGVNGVNGNKAAVVGPMFQGYQVSRAGGHAVCFLEALCT